MRALVVHVVTLCCAVNMPIPGLAQTDEQKPVYFGQRSANPKHETFGRLVGYERPKLQNWGRRMMT
ncbi:hypothetical protein [Mesorhizobium sp.]|uniref:hypothetical protein n=1 Tax=Mesorhizobium sp. TaxID=1871066 RepID=UPI0025BD0F89|nr:hypothetical protein [Mesorhizobium sp.]